MRMQTLVQYGLKQNNIELLKSYIPWAQAALKQTPDVTLFAAAELRHAEAWLGHLPNHAPDALNKSHPTTDG